MPVDMPCKFTNTIPYYIANDNQPHNDHIIIPTVDYSMLFSDDDNQRSKALNYLNHVCQEYGFFYLVNHGVPDNVFLRVLKAISDFFNPTEMEDRRIYVKKNPTDRIRWGLCSSSEENREYLKVVIHPQFHCPPKPSDFSEALQDYTKRLRDVELGLAKAVSKALGFEEDYIEKALNLDSGFDVFVANLYPPNFQSNGSMGLDDHTDPGFIVSLIQDVNGGLQVLSRDGKWINVNMPPNVLFIILSDHTEIVTNGKYKSSIHRVVVGDNKVKRISATTLHGPSLDTVVKPAPEFFDNSDHPQPQAYRGMTYKQSLEANGFDEIDLKSTLQQLRLTKK